MKRSNKSIALILASALMLGGTGSALAYGSYHDRGNCNSRDSYYSHGTPMRALGQLDLTDEQRDKVKALFKEQRDAMRDNMDAMQDNRDELRDAMQKGAGEKAIRGLAEKQGDLVTEMIVNRVQVQEKLNAILTKEQRDELQKMQKERRDDRRDRSDDDDRPRW